MNNDRYIIVVEVDNKRALAAFQKGMDDIALVLPQFMAKAEATDLAIDNENSERLRVYLAARDDYKKAQSKYEAYVVSRKKYNETPWIQRSSLPVPVPTPPPDSWSYRLLSPNTIATYAVKELQSFVAELKRNRDIASAASAPYKMVERDALAMIGWEDGSSLEYAKRRFLD